MAKNPDMPKLEAMAPTDLESHDIPDKYWDHITGRDKYFKPEINRDYDIVAIRWKPISMPGRRANETKEGLQLQVIKIDGVEITEVEKLWTITSSRTLRELEPIMRAARAKRRTFIHIQFRKSLGKAQKDTDAIFTAKNLDNEIADLIPADDDED